MKRPSLSHVFKSTLLGAAVILTGCAGKQPIDLQAASQNSQLVPVTIQTTDYRIQTLQPANHTGELLRVYIEGDGRAWVTSRTVSDDPTPVSSFMPELALTDPTPSVYMGRPCQFSLGPKCNKSMWTSNRFSQEAVGAMSEALDTLKAEYGNQQFDLVGYSGGGAIALLLAASRSDVAQVQTIGGNVDVAAWTAVKKLSPLTGSLNPADFADKLVSVPQRHIVGLKDKTVPGDIIDSYMLKVQPKCGEVSYVNSDHWDGYAEHWPLYRDKGVSCP